MDAFHLRKVRVETKTRFDPKINEHFKVINARPRFLYFMTYKFGISEIKISNISDVLNVYLKKKKFRIGFKTDGMPITNIFGDELLRSVREVPNDVLIFHQGFVLVGEEEAVMQNVTFNGTSFITDNGNKYGTDRVVFLQFIESPQLNVSDYEPIYLSKLLTEYDEKNFVGRRDKKILTDLEIKSNSLQNEFIERIEIEKENRINRLMTFKNIMPVVSSFHIEIENQVLEILPGDFSYLLYEDNFLYEREFDEGIVIKKFPKNIFHGKVNLCIIKLFFGSLYNSKFPQIHDILKYESTDIFLTIKILHILELRFMTNIMKCYFDILQNKYLIIYCINI